MPKNTIKKYNDLVKLSFGVLFSIFLVHTFFSSQKQFDELALGEETKSIFATSGQYPVHLHLLNKESIKILMKGWDVRGKKDCLLFLGNSQMHAINQLKDGQSTYLGLLKDSINRMDILGISFPNANLQEHWLAFSYLQKQLPIRFLVLPVFMDDLREDGIRTDGSFETLKSENFTLPIDLAINKKINQELQSKGNDVTGNTNDLAALNQTVQEKTEKAFNEFLESHSTVWHQRAEIRGEIFSLLYQARNTVLGINAQTKRRLIPQKYSDNLDALKALLASAQTSGIKVLLYVPPIRQDVEPPYDKNEYLKFKDDLKALALHYPNVSFADYDAIVPGQYWGMKDSTNIGGKVEYDFMHFQYPGHQIFAKALRDDLVKILP